jgi:tetratricopeptide (TPR) repeat protein
MGTQTKSKTEVDVDGLFMLPLAEFVGARKTLAARLIKEGHADEANRVKALTKPPISAWTVNQLYWQHRELFNRLITAGERFRKAQASGSAGKISDMREALDERREVLAHLSDLATRLLQDAGHNPSLDVIRRITTTLEAMSAYSSQSEEPGRLTKDVDPPGFESLASFTSSAGPKERSREPVRSSHATKSGSVPSKAPTKAIPASKSNRVEESRQAKLAVAKVAVQEAKELLADARSRIQSLEAAQKKAGAAAKEAEKRRREAEELFKKATLVSETATRRARNISVEVDAATKGVENAKRNVDKVTKALEALFRGSPSR